MTHPGTTNSVCYISTPHALQRKIFIYNHSNFLVRCIKLLIKFQVTDKQYFLKSITYFNRSKQQHICKTFLCAFCLFGWQ